MTEHATKTVETSNSGLANKTVLAADQADQLSDANCNEAGHALPQSQPSGRKSAYHYEDLIACARGKLFGLGNAQLPLPNMLMFDRITSITRDGGLFNKGKIVAEFDIKPDLWFFKCHFDGDPVMPGCLGLDAMWQLLGFFLGWLGGAGRGRALGLGELRLSGQVLPSAGKVIYEVNLKRVVMRRLVMGIADGIMSVDGKKVSSASDMRVGLFSS